MSDKHIGIQNAQVESCILKQKEGRVIFDSTQIANYLIKCRPGLTPMALQKLIYFAHGYFLAATGKPLLNESVEAWQWGPVIPSLYHQLKTYGSDPIPSQLVDEDGISPSLEPDDPSVRSLLNKILSEYGDLAANKLVAITHLPGSPWATVVDECKSKNDGVLLKFKEIDNATIEKYYKKKLRGSVS